jgi:membrane protein YdbS with pleckstrin-like domain
MASFKTKYDAWLMALAAGYVALMGFCLFGAWRDGRWVTGLLIVVGLVVMVWTLLGVRYVVSETKLDIRSGPLRWCVPLTSIHSVEPTRDPTSGPAWSLDRLRVTATERSILISPRDKAGLLDALQARDPGLRRDGERLVRSAE